MMSNPVSQILNVTDLGKKAHNKVHDGLRGALMFHDSLDDVAGGLESHAAIYRTRQGDSVFELRFAFADAHPKVELE